MTLTLVVARARNGVIGRDGGLPWHIPDDLKRFKRLTLGKPMIMGRRTFDSLPGVLPGRRHLVLSRDPAWTAAGAERVGSVADAMQACGGEASVIGGAEIFALFEPYADRWELTEVQIELPGDTFLPEPDPAHWQEVARDDRVEYSFVTLERRTDA